MRVLEVLAFLLAALGAVVYAWEKQLPPALVAASLACWFAVAAFQLT